MVPREDRYWNGQAARLALAVNASWVAQRFLPLLIAANFAGMIALLLARGQAWPLAGLAAAYAAVLALALAFAWWRARPNFARASQALGRLDLAHGFGGQLIAAAAGHCDWPKPPQRVRWDLRVSWRAPLRPVGLSLALLAAGLLWPLPGPAKPTRREAAHMPHAWERMAEVIDALELSELIDEPAIDALESRLDKLREQPPNEWYSAGSMEASSFALSATEKAGEAFLQALQTASYHALRLANGDGQTRAGESRAQLLNEALTQLDLGTLPLRPDLNEALQNIARNDSARLSPEKMQELLDRLEDGAGACRQGLGLPPLKLEEMTPEMAAEFGFGPEGGGPVPLTFRRDASPDLPGEASAVSNPDMERAILGDTAYASTYQSEHYDPAYEGLEASARSDHLGSGGDAVWKTSARPDEQAVLKQFYKQ